MKASEVRAKIEEWTMENSGVEHRDYLGMSQVCRCPVEMYQGFMSERQVRKETAIRMYEGNLHKNELLDRLVEIGIARRFEGELVASFDQRFRGHPQAELVHQDGNGHVTLLMVHAVNRSKFDEVRETNRALQSHYEVAQCYMAFGGYSHGTIIYKCREDGDLWVVQVTEHRKTQERLERKVREVLAAIDAGEPPECTCGRH